MQEFDFNKMETENFVSEEEVVDEQKPRRVRRTKAEMEAARLAEQNERQRQAELKVIFEDFDGDPSLLADMARSLSGRPRDIHHQLQRIQQTLKVSKENINEKSENDSFAYRTLEEIYEQLKPILSELDCTLEVPVKPMAVGNYIFVTAEAILRNARGETRSSTASAMVNLTMMSNKFPAQETLACGTMASKAAIAGLFLLDNTAKEQQVTVVEPDSVGSKGASAPQPTQPIAQVAAQAKPKESEVKVEDPASTKPAVVNAEPKSSAPVTPAPTRSVAGVLSGKPVLDVNSPLFQRLGTKVAQFNGSADQLIGELRKAYSVSDAVADEFIRCFFSEDNNARA